MADAMTGYTIMVDDVELGGPHVAPVESIRVEQSTRLPDVFTIEVADPGFESLDANQFPIGAKVEISLSGAEDPVMVTTCEVTALAHNGQNLVVQGFDPAHRLHRSPKTRTFAQMTDSDIVTKIAREYSLMADVDSTPEVHDYVVQFTESDYGFLKRRARRIGFDLWVADENLYFKKTPESPVATKLTWMKDLIQVNVRLTAAERADEVVVRGWDYIAKEPLEGRSSEQDAGSTATAADDVVSQANQAFGTVTRTMAREALSTQAEADELARSLSLLASGGSVTMKAVTAGNPSIRAGSVAEIQGVGERLSGEYHVTEVEHSVRPAEGYQTRFVAGPKDSAGLADLLGGSAASQTSSGASVPVFGKVTDNADPQAIGRVKVEFGHLTGTESTWAPVVSSGAGADRGIQFIPEIGDQVVVIFEQGDPSRPIVLGGIWSNQDAPSEPSAVSNGVVNLRTIRTREGHHLTFTDDGPGLIQLSLGDDSCSLHLEGSETKLTGDQKLTIEGADIEIVAAGKLTLKGNQVEIAASADVKVSGATIQLN